MSRKAHLRTNLTAGSVVAGVLLAASAAAPAWAQSAPAGATNATSAAQATPADDAVTVDEIVVTGNKFGTSNDKAPVAVTALSPEVLTQARIQSLADVAQRAPSLNYSSSGGFAIAYIRGVGSNFSLAGLESAVATYVDGVYQQRQAGAVLDLVDVESVSVLKGPQGTLYGRNATGGAILLQTANPTYTFGGFVGAEAGNFEQKKVEGAINIPLSDTLSIRLAGRHRENGDYVTNVPGGAGRGAQTADYLRAKIRWNPTDQFQAIYGIEFGNSRSTTYSAKQLLDAPNCLVCSVLGAQRPGLLTDDFYTSSITDDVFNHNKFVAQTLTLGYTNDHFALTSITGYRDQDYEYVNDQDQTVPKYFSSHFTESGPTLFTDNYLRTTFDGPLNALVGFTYLRERNDQVGTYSGIQFGSLVAVNGNDIQIDSKSIYAELTYDFGNGFKLSGGARYNKDEKSIDVSNNADAIAALRTIASFTNSADFSNVTPRAVFSYENGGSYYYASYNRGARSGGFSSPLIAPGIAVDPETLDIFEVGGKNRLFDDRLRMNYAAFYGIYKDIQIQVVDAAFGTVRLQNAAEGKVYGAEFEGTFAVTPAFKINGGVTWLGNEFSDFKNAAVFVPKTAGAGLATGSADLSGTPLNRSPEWSGFVSADYTMDLSRGFSLKAAASARFTSSFNFTPGAGGPLGMDRQDGYTLVDASLTLTTPDDVDLGVFVQNLFEEEYATQRSTAAYGSVEFASMPRSYGVRVTKRF
jgi:iron complex outermembrane receptor protein